LKQLFDPNQIRFPLFFYRRRRISCFFSIFDKWGDTYSYLYNQLVIFVFFSSLARSYSCLIYIHEDIDLMSRNLSSCVISIMRTNTDVRENQRTEEHWDRVEKQKFNEKKMRETILKTIIIIRILFLFFLIRYIFSSLSLFYLSLFSAG